MEDRAVSRRDDRRILKGGEGSPPVLVLQEGPSRRTRRRRRIVAALLLVVLLVGAYLGRDALERWTGVEIPGVSQLVESSRSGASSASAVSGDSASAVSGDSASAREGTVGGAAPGPGGAASPAVLLERRLDSLSVVLDRYRERHGDFVQGRLGCQGLTRGFTEVEDRFAAASQAFGRLEARGGGDSVTAGGLAGRYRRLSTTTDSVGRLYVASGCVEEGDAPPG
jgi:hypothetical protein